MQSPPHAPLDALSGEWVSLQDAARTLGISVDTARRRAKRGELTARQLPTRQGFVWQVLLGNVPTQPMQQPEVGSTPTQATQATALAALVRDLQQQNLELAGRLGFLEARHQADQDKILALSAPAAKARPWWAFWR